MTAQPNALLGIFEGGQMTDLPAYPGAVDLTALMEIVSPGNAALGINYAITLAQLALIIGGSTTPTIIKSGTSYASVATDTRILADLTVPGVLAVTLLPSTNYFQPILVKDIAGNVSNVDTLTVSFSSGQTADGQSSIVFQTAYEGVWFNPLAAGGFYLTAA